MCTPKPSVGQRAPDDSNRFHVPPPGTVAHGTSARFRMYQPSSAGRRPVSVFSILASCMSRTLVGCVQIGLDVAGFRWPGRHPADQSGLALEVLVRTEEDVRGLL